MDQSHEAFAELSTLGAIVDSTKNGIILNRKRLYDLGYILIFSVSQPIFVTLNDFSYMYDSIIYDSDTIPYSSLDSFTLCKLKSDYSSI